MDFPDLRDFPLLFKSPSNLGIFCQFKKASKHFKCHCFHSAIWLLESHFHKTEKKPLPLVEGRGGTTKYPSNWERTVLFRVTDAVGCVTGEGWNWVGWGSNYAVILYKIWTLVHRFYRARGHTVVSKDPGVRSKGLQALNWQLALN